MLARTRSCDSVATVGLTMLKAVNGAAARRISLPFIQRERLIEFGLAVLIWSEIAGQHNASFVSSDILEFVLKSRRRVPLVFIRECRDGMTLHVQAGGTIAWVSSDS